MKKLFLIIVFSLVTASCASVTDVPLDCPEMGGKRWVKIYYGDDGITIREQRNVKRRSVFYFKLKPESREYRDRLVTIDGVSVTPDGSGVADPDWLDTSDTYNTRDKFVYCTPEVPRDTDQFYKYDVEVEGLERIDPRVKVEY